MQVVIINYPTKHNNLLKTFEEFEGRLQLVTSSSLVIIVKNRRTFGWFD